MKYVNLNSVYTLMKDSDVYRQAALLLSAVPFNLGKQHGLPSYAPLKKVMNRIMLNYFITLTVIALLVFNICNAIFSGASWVMVVITLAAFMALSKVGRADINVARTLASNLQFELKKACIEAGIKFK